MAKEEEEGNGGTAGILLLLLRDLLLNEREEIFDGVLFDNGEVLLRDSLSN